MTTEERIEERFWLRRDGRFRLYDDAEHSHTMATGTVWRQAGGWLWQLTTPIERRQTVGFATRRDALADVVRVVERFRFHVADIVDQIAKA